jgi:CheY-like chemotaxis protein
VIVECLREIGHFVAEADSGRSGLAILERGDPCDLVVIDQLTPGLLGIEMVRLARLKRPELKVLFIIGYAGLIRARDEQRPLIMKPFKMLWRGEVHPFRLTMSVMCPLDHRLRSHRADRLTGELCHQRRLTDAL